MTLAIDDSWPTTAERDPALLMRAGVGLFSALAMIAAIVLSAGESKGAVQTPAYRIARAAAGDYSEQTLRTLAAGMDPAMIALAVRFDPFRAPRPEQPFFDLTDRPAPAIVRALSALTPQDALTVNNASPFSDAPNPPARPFSIASASAQDQARALQCMTQAIYYEAGFEPIEGQRAVAQVVLNRMRHPAFPKSVCGVVFQGSNLSTGCQFSFTCDGSMNRPAAPAAWARARQVADEALHGAVMKAVGEATHYHTQWVAAYWAPRLYKVKQVGAHLFYRWPGSWGLPPAFHYSYAGNERPGVDVGGSSSPLDPAAVKLAEAAAPANETADVQAARAAQMAQAATTSPPVPAEAAPAADPALAGPAQAVADAATPAPRPRPRAPPRLPMG